MKDDFKKEFGPSSWAIDNKTAIYVLTVIITIMGYFGYQGLPKENFPEVLISFTSNKNLARSLRVKLGASITCPRTIALDNGAYLEISSTCG